MKKGFYTLMFSVAVIYSHAQLNWINVDSLYLPLPNNFHVYKTIDLLNGEPNIAFYVIADLKDKNLIFDTDTSKNRRLTPSQFYSKNNQPLLVVNTTFFSFQTNQNLNVVVKNKKTVSYNIHTINGRGKDTFTYRHTLGSAFGIYKNRTADIAWVYTDSTLKFPYALQSPLQPIKDSSFKIDFRKMGSNFKKWKVKTALGGGPVLIQNNEFKITNNEELKFAEKAINDKHPRTVIGYTKENKIIVLVIQGRFTGIAKGATLLQEAQIMKDLGCVEAMNLDGGGSSCLLINGKETIQPSDKEGQRAIPGVFIISAKK